MTEAASAPAAATPQAGGQTIDAEIATISGSMFNADGSRNSGYWQDESAQSRLASLLTAKERGTIEPADVQDQSNPYEGQHSYRLGEFAGDPDAEAFASVVSAAGAPEELLHAILDDDTPEDPETDAADRQKVETQLREVWGGEYGAKVDSIKRYLGNNLPAGVGQMLMGARVGGHALLNNASLLMELASMAERSPKFVSTGDREKDIQAIEALMSHDMDAYRRDTALQLRLRSLYAARGR